MSIFRIILLLFRAFFRERSQLALENLALRQQLAVLRHRVVRPRLRNVDRAFWVSLARVWDQWRSALILVRPETVLRWHRQGFRYFWRWKSRGRRCVSPELIRLIRRMSQNHIAEWAIPLRGINWFMVRTHHTNCFTIDHYTYGWTLRADAEEVYVVFDFTRFKREDVFDLSERPRIMLLSEPNTTGREITDQDAWEKEGRLQARVTQVKKGTQLILYCKWKRASTVG